MAKETKKKKATAKRVQSNFTFEGKRYYVYGTTLKEAHIKAEEKRKELENRKLKKRPLS